MEGITYSKQDIFIKIVISQVNGKENILEL